MAELPDPDRFKAASDRVCEDAVAEQISCGPSPQHRLEAVLRGRKTAA